MKKIVFLMSSLFLFSTTIFANGALRGNFDAIRRNHNARAAANKYTSKEDYAKRCNSGQISPANATFCNNYFTQYMTDLEGNANRVAESVRKAEQTAPSSSAQVAPPGTLAAIVAGTSEPVSSIVVESNGVERIEKEKEKADQLELTIVTSQQELDAAQRAYEGRDIRDRQVLLQADITKQSQEVESLEMRLEATRREKGTGSQEAQRLVTVRNLEKSQLERLQRELDNLYMQEAQNNSQRLQQARTSSENPKDISLAVGPEKSEPTASVPAPVVTTRSATPAQTPTPASTQQENKITLEQRKQQISQREIDSLNRQISRRDVENQFSSLRYQNASVQQRLKILQQKYDNALVGYYIKEKLARLSNSDVICEKSAACTSSGSQEINNLSDKVKTQIFQNLKK